MIGSALWTSMGYKLIDRHWTQNLKKEFSNGEICPDMERAIACDEFQTTGDIQR